MGTPKSSIIITKQEVGAQGVVLHLKGIIDEYADFASMLPKPPKALQLHLKEIERISSAGAAAWIKFFSGLRSRGMSLKLVECSVQIVQQLNLVPHFSCGADVGSIALPFLCKACQKELNGYLTVVEARKFIKKVPPVTCPKCSGFAEFDDIEAEYFSFISRIKAS